jgi:cobalt-zinc-cadmium efflux system membrane fusion protein
MKRNVVLILALTVVASAGAYLYLTAGREKGAPKTLSAAICAEHRLPEAECPFCDKSLIKKRGLCAEHDVAEALCYRCNPALIPAFKAEGDWCAEHDSPESQCTICNPELLSEVKTARDMNTEAASIQLTSGQPTPAAEIPRSKRAPSVECDTQKLRVQFSSHEIAQNAGLEYARTQRRPIRETLECNAELEYDRNRYASLSSRVPGVIREVRKGLGEEVEAGDVLVVVDSAETGKAKAEYLQAGALVTAAEKNYAREQRLLEHHVAIEQDVLEAERQLAESRIARSSATQSLRNLGLSNTEIDKLSQSQDTSSLLPLRAPFAGTVIERNAVVGEVVDTLKALFEIADTSKLWAMLDVNEADARKVRSGQPVIIAVEGLPGEISGGRITWISSQIDPKTRTLKALAQIENPDGRLRANMFGKAVVTIHDDEPVVVVPREAVQWEGCCNIVFVKHSDTLFEPRKVRLGYETEKIYVVEQGLDAEETVVTTGSFLLKTEILKGSIGAGCCELGQEK